VTPLISPEARVCQPCTQTFCTPKAVQLFRPVPSLHLYRLFRSVPSLHLYRLFRPVPSLHLYRLFYGSGAHPASYSTGAESTAAGAWSCHSTPSSAEVKNDGNYTSTPPVCLHGVERGSCTNLWTLLFTGLNKQRTRFETASNARQALPTLLAVVSHGAVYTVPACSALQVCNSRHRIRFRAAPFS
jgi:hypothetical protein